jgi:DNA-binding transcriptional MerR regulator
VGAVLMFSLTFHSMTWPMVLIVLFAWGFAPGAVLRLIVLLFPKGDPRRLELLGELHAVPRLERPLWVLEQLEVGLFEGLRHRWDRGRAHKQVATPEPLEQRLLFADDVVIQPGRIGYRGPAACAAAGISFRQLDYWARTGLVEPSARAAVGSDLQRLYSFNDIVALKVVKRLLDTGISLQQVRVAIGHLRARGVADLARVTLMSDGYSVYECTSPDEVVDLLAGGQGVFGVALGRIWQEIDGTLAELPGEEADNGGDQLSPDFGQLLLPYSHDA